MRAVLLVVLSCVAVPLLCSAVYAGPDGGDVAAMLVREYPIMVKVQEVAEGTQQSVVYVLIRWDSCRNPKAVALNEFMDKYVPEALRRTGRLPQALDCATKVNEGVVDIEKRLGKAVHILDQGRLPVWLEVSAVKNQGVSISQDENERFTGDISDAWSINSCFVTRFCAKAEITKFHDEQEYQYIKPMVFTGKRTVFRWVDP